MKEKNTAAELDCPITKHSPKRWVLALILGVFIGLAVIVPGVSGSTIAIIFGLYTGMLYAIGHILSDFKRAFPFLLPIGIGVIVGFGAGFLIIREVFNLFLFQVICLFVGLMLGAMPALTKEIKGAAVTAPRVVLLIVGFLIPLAIGALSIVLSAGDDPESTATYTAFPFWLFLCYLPLGFTVAVTQIVPGLSATAILMAFGQFRPILNSLHKDFIFENPVVLLLYACLGIGFLVGLVAVSRAFSAIIKRHKHTAFFMVTGLAFGSIASMFLNTDMYELYVSWVNSSVPWLDIVIGAVLFAIGLVGSFLLTKYELSRES